MEPLSRALRRVIPQNRVIPLADDPEGIEKFLLERPLLPVAAYVALIRAERAELAHLSGKDRSYTEIGIEKLELALQLAETREQLLETRPPGCFCYGLGGMQRKGIPLPDGEIFQSWRVWCTCPEAEQLQAERARVIAETHRLKTQRLADRLFGSLPERFVDWTFASLAGLSPPHMPTIALVKEWLADDRRWALVLRGEVSTGKTGLAVSALKEANEQGKSALYVDVASMLTRLKNSFGSIDDKLDRQESMSADKQWEALHGVDVLLIDDLGVEYHRANGPGTDWATEQLWTLISTRHANRQKTIVTSNLSLQQLTELFRHGRISARLAEESLVINTSDLPAIRQPGQGQRRA